MAMSKGLGVAYWPFVVLDLTDGSYKIVGSSGFLLLQKMLKGRYCLVYTLS